MKMEKEHSDDDLIEQIRLGDEKAAEELIRRYYTAILRYCKNHCFNQEKAEDLTQETFLKLFKNLSGYKGKRKFKAYLYTIANHLCIDESRKIEAYPLKDEEEARKWQAKETVANLRHEGRQVALRIISEHMPGEMAVPCEATLEDLYLYYFPTGQEGV